LRELNLRKLVKFVSKVFDFGTSKRGHGTNRQNAKAQSCRKIYIPLGNLLRNRQVVCHIKYGNPKLQKWPEARKMVGVGQTLEDEFDKQ